MRVAGSIQRDQPVDRLTVQTVLVGELRGPHLEGFVQIHKGAVQRKPLHAAYPASKECPQAGGPTTASERATE